MNLVKEARNALVDKTVTNSKVYFSGDKTYKYYYIIFNGRYNFNGTFD